MGFRTSTLVAALAIGAALSGCAGFNQLNNSVSTFGDWPADRKPASYTFERLPSQQAQADRQQRLEDAARPALEGAGFTAAVDTQAADVSVLIGARISPNEPAYYDDPFWWRGGLFYGRHFGYWRGPWIGRSHFYTPTYEREVAVLIRDRKSGTTLYEARASNDGASPAIASLLPAMFEAALKDFPQSGNNPRRVTTQIAPQ